MSDAEVDALTGENLPPPDKDAFNRYLQERERETPGFLTQVHAAKAEIAEVDERVNAILDRYFANGCLKSQLPVVKNAFGAGVQVGKELFRARLADAIRDNPELPDLLTAVYLLSTPEEDDAD